MEFAKLIDHTILSPVAGKKEIEKTVNEAKEYGFKSVCVNSAHTREVKSLLHGTEILTCTVVGFPLGACAPEIKAFETSYAVSMGADEIDMVMNIGAFKDEEYTTVKSDIEGVIKAAKGKTVKVILENCYLDKDEIRKACELAMEAGAQFVKSSTGFGPYGAKLQDIKIMKESVRNKGFVKASGGIKTKQDLFAMIEAGADRIGSSSGCEIMEAIKNGK